MRTHPSRDKLGKFLISGHSDRDGLAIYQNLSLADVADEYQDAMKDFPTL